jgi:hypothetical protein
VFENGSTRPLQGAPSPTSHAQPGLPTSTASRPSQFPRRIPQHKAAPPRPLLSAATPRGAPTCPLSGLPRRRRRSRLSQKPDPDPARSGEIPLVFSLLLPPLDLRTSPHRSTTSDRRARPSIPLLLPSSFWSSSLLRSRVYVWFPCQIWVVFGRLRWFSNGCPSLSSLLVDWINHCS